ncbi:hypothetical protein I204_03394 [Kwoniella mangroviensis CBS 8886]|nr:hypothetical protein I204_03394 [Kwoniella mangroviensis CBS 8886]
MSLPPINPDRTASGIIVDPRTLERVIPQSRRKDGTVRKEQKVRPGFTPQEDVGRFRSTRQAAEDARAASRPTIPGSDRLGSQANKGGKEENVFASETREKTKAQLKNEKRREKRREKVSVNWDEDDDEDEDVGKLDEEFKKVDIARQQGAEQSFPPLEGGGGVPEESILDNIKSNEDEEKSDGKTAAIEPSPPAPSGSQPETASEQKTTTDKPSLLNDRKNEVQQAQKPHPIQGGRKGPIGLANPPPLEEKSQASPSRADQDDWRTQTRKKSNNHNSNRSGKQNQGNRPANTNRPTQPSEPSPQPRERKEYKVREGGANDLSSLASRVKNLVVANTVGNASRDYKDKKEESKASA